MSDNRKTKEPEAWFELLDDEGYRMDSLGAYHGALLRLAEHLLKTV